MTESATTTTPNPYSATASADDRGEGHTGANSEAARYRRQLREVEAERDRLRASLDTTHRREIDRVAAEYIVDPGLFRTLAGVETAELLADDGTVDADVVASLARGIAEQRPYLAPGALRTSSDPDAGKGGATPTTPKWSDVLKRTR